MLAPTTQQTRIMDWMRRQITPEACVSVSDVTSMYSVLSVVGPKSRDMLSNLCNTDLIFYGHMAKVNAQADILILIEVISSHNYTFIFVYTWQNCNKLFSKF